MKIRTLLLTAGMALFLSSAALCKSSISLDTMETNKPYTVLLLMNATPKWLSLTREERSNYFEKNIAPVFSKLAKTVTVRLYDSEYFHAKVSDFLIIEATRLDDYRLLIEYLRDSRIYSAPYFEIVDIIPGQENLFEDFNEFFRKEHQK